MSMSNKSEWHTYTPTSQHFLGLFNYAQCTSKPNHIGNKSCHFHNDLNSAKGPVVVSVCLVCGYLSENKNQSYPCNKGKNDNTVLHCNSYCRYSMRGIGGEERIEIFVLERELHTGVWRVNFFHTINLDTVFNSSKSSTGL